MSNWLTKVAGYLPDVLGAVATGGASIPLTAARIISKEVFGEDPDDQENFAEPELTPTLAKLAEYAKRAGISKELIEFLESEYGIHESTGYSGTIMIEDIGRIFRSIVREERFGRVELLRRYENDQLGRIKK